MAAAGGGNGGGGREIEAGRAFVALKLKDEVASGLDKLKRKFSTFAEEARKSVGKGFGAGIGLNITDLLGSGVKSGIGALVEGVRSILPGTETAAELFKDMAAATEKAAQDAAKLSTEFGKLAAFSKGGALAELRGREADAFAPILAGVQAQRDEAKKVLKAVEEMNMAQRGLAWLAAGTGLVESRTEILNEANAKLMEAEKAYADIEARRTAAIEARSKIIDPATDPAFVRTVDDLSQGMGDALDPTLKAMGQFEKAAFLIRRENEAANEATKQRLKDLQDEGRLTDRQLRAAEERARVAADFAAEMRSIEFDRITKGLTPEAKRLAGMIDRGWSNDQILEAQDRMRSLRAPDDLTTMTKGLGASVNAALSLGVADQWKRQEKLAELTLEQLQSMRQTLDALKNNLAFR